ncbi:MAG: DNA primase [Bacteroidota bacterium]|nr:DNA primase [Bacteroidota bacterium]
MIDQATIEKIHDAAEIVDVVQDFVTLKKRGTNYLGLCPFHNEKTPSFIVSPAKGIFKCFGCGKGGNSVNFIMEHEHLIYTDALRYLARKFNIPIAEKEETAEDQRLRDERESLMIVSDFAGKYFSQILHNDNEGRSIGLSYFRQRGVRDDIIQKFELGYCPDRKDAFTQAAQRQGYRMEFLEKTGLTIRRDDWVRDRFGGRIIFPVHNLAGRVIAFGGRTLKNDSNTAKYLNSPESDIYHKSQVLYGLFHAKREITRKDKCFLVEGYVDVLAMHQAGIENVVASSGTSLTVEQIRLIKRFTNNVTILYDGDAAGIKASLRGIDLVLEQGLHVKVLLLPDGHDPDSFSRTISSSQLIKYIDENESDFIKFKTKLLLSTTQNDPVERARLVSNIVQSISVIPDVIIRSEYIRECSSLLDVNEEILYQEIRKLKQKETETHYNKTVREHNAKPAPTANTSPASVNLFDAEEKAILRLLIKYWDFHLFEEEINPNETQIIKVGEYVFQELEGDDFVSSNPIYQKMIDEFKTYGWEPGFDCQRYFTNHPDSKICQLATNLLAEKYIESIRWQKNGSWMETEEEILFTLVPKSIEEYKLRKAIVLEHDILKEMQAAQSDHNEDKIIELQMKWMNLKQVVKILSESLGRRAITR